MKLAQHWEKWLESEKKIIENTLTWYAYHTRILILISAILSEMEIQANVSSQSIVYKEQPCAIHTGYTSPSLSCLPVVKEMNKKGIITQIIALTLSPGANSM